MPACPAVLARHPHAVQSQGVRPALRQLLEAGGDVPALVLGRRTVAARPSGVLRLRRPIGGEPELNFENLVLPDDSGQMLRIFSAGRGRRRPIR
ncbi:hypothetical protein ACQCSU_13080 [Pseudarthrobacter sp. O4]|uniref:hypothetical protein n=1 Tax=Pseudarthrobacter sp. O4 TaxID=3418417 RepID=UPI003CF01153